MKITKPQSLTTDTRLSQSHFFNNLSLNKTNLTSTSQNCHKIPHSFEQQNSKETDFLHLKNCQLQERVARMAEQIKELEENKINLLKINQKYIGVINQYYRDLHEGNHIKENSSVKLNHHNKKEPHLKAKTNSVNKEENLSLTKVQSNTSNPQFSDQRKDANLELVLSELQKDHRNLSKHVLVMETEIKNYACEMEKFNQMKSELLAVNHTTPKQLIAELEEVVRQNKQLKKQNNRLNFQLQKNKSECNKLKKAKQIQNKNLSAKNEELQKLKSQINKTLQSTADKSHQYEQRIYELELKTEKLERELRQNQLYVSKQQERRKNFEIQRVEDVHENTFLRTSLTELLDPKKHRLLKIDRSFIQKKNNQKPMSLNKTMITLK